MKIKNEVTLPILIFLIFSVATVCFLPALRNARADLWYQKVSSMLNSRLIPPWKLYAHDLAISMYMYLPVNWLIMAVVIATTLTLFNFFRDIRTTRALGLGIGIIGLLAFSFQAILTYWWATEDMFSSQILLLSGNYSHLTYFVSHSVFNVKNFYISAYSWALVSLCNRIIMIGIYLFGYWAILRYLHNDSCSLAVCIMWIIGLLVISPVCVAITIFFFDERFVGVLLCLGIPWIILAIAMILLLTHRSARQCYRKNWDS